MKLDLKGQLIDLNDIYPNKSEVDELIINRSSVRNFFNLEFEAEALFLFSLSSHLIPNAQIVNGSLRDNISFKQGTYDFWDTLYALKPGTYNFNLKSLVFTNNSNDETIDNMLPMINLVALLKKDYLITKSINDGLGILQQYITYCVEMIGKEMTQELEDLINSLPNYKNEVYTIHGTNASMPDGYWIEFRNQQNEPIGCLWVFYPIY